MTANFQTAPTVVSLFSGAGGLDVGLERAGWRTVVATDADADCLATLDASKQAQISIEGEPERYFLSNTRTIHSDVRELCADDLRPEGAGRDWRPALLAGGPPLPALVLGGTSARPRRP